MNTGFFRCCARLPPHTSVIPSFRFQTLRLTAILLCDAHIALPVTSGEKIGGWKSETFNSLPAQYSSSSSVTSDMPLTRHDFQVLADLRAEEAAVLVQNRKQQGAYYLAGYAVECALKACIAKNTKRHEFPPKKTDRFYSHNLESLLEEAGLKPQLDKDLEKQRCARSKLGCRQELERNE